MLAIVWVRFPVLLCGQATLSNSELGLLLRLGVHLVFYLLLPMLNHLRSHEKRSLSVKGVLLSRSLSVGPTAERHLDMNYST